MTAKPLKLVTDEDHPRKAQSVKAAADSGVRRDLLVALRARIARDIDDSGTPPRDLAALSRRLMDIANEIAAMDAADEGDDIGDAAATPDEAWESAN